MLITIVYGRDVGHPTTCKMLWRFNSKTVTTAIKRENKGEKRE